MERLMRDLIGILTSALLAGVVGFLAERTRMRQVVQSAGAALVGGALGCLLQSGLAIALGPWGGHLVAVSFALTSELCGAVILVVVLAVGGHWFLGLVGALVRLPIARHRPLILALLAGIFQGFVFPMYPCPQLAV
jgi:hypothetical protein